MWHTCFTLPGNAAPGNYSASFEVFVANATFTGGTGHADYTTNALEATRDTSYNTVTINYSWTAVPEPSSCLLLLGAGAFVLGIGMRHTRRQKA